MQVAALFDDDPAQRPRRIGARRQPMVGADNHGVALRRAAVAVEVLARGVEAADDPAGDFDAPLRPHVLQALEVGINEPGQQRCRGGVEPGNGGAEELVGQPRAVDRRIPGGGLDGRLRPGGEGRGVSGFAGGGVVPGELLVQLLLRGLAVGGEGVPEGSSAVRRPRRGRRSRWLPSRRPWSRPSPLASYRLVAAKVRGPGQLLVGPRRRRAQLLGRSDEEAAANRVAPAAGHVAFDRRRRRCPARSAARRSRVRRGRTAARRRRRGPPA